MRTIQFLNAGRWISMLGVLAVLSALLPPASAAERFSYLMEPSASGVQVMVHTDDTSAVPAHIRVRYGTTTAYGATAAANATAGSLSSSPVSYVYTVSLAGLAAETLYHYAVSVDTGATWSADRSFHTAPRPGSSFRFAAYSDFRNGTAMFDKLTGLVKARSPLMVLEPGDMASDTAYGSFTGQYFTSACVSLIQAVPLFHAPGNHEGWSGNTLSFFRPAGQGDYGSYDYGDVHVVIINDYVSCTVGSAQYDFIRADLAASTKPWKIAAFHEPAYTSTSDGHSGNATMQTVTADLLEPNGVKVVVCGHNHFYQRSLVNGVQHLVVGGGGAPQYTPTAGPDVVVFRKAYCYVIFDATPTALTVHAYDDSDAQIDAFALSSSTRTAQSITFAAIGGKTFGVAPITLSATASSGLPVAFSVVSGPATVSGSTLTITGAGTVVVAADQAGNGSWLAAPQVAQTVVVAKAAQAITFAPIGDQSAGVAPITMSAVASSGLSVTFSVISGPATVNGSTLTIAGAGTVTVAANQAGNANYLAAAQVTQTITVSASAKIAQTIAFTAIGNQTYGVPPIGLAATASSGLPVVFSVVSGPATVSGSRLTITGAGSVVVAASQAGNATYVAAQATQAITVAKAAQAINFAAIADQTVGAAPIALSATASSGLPVAFSVVSGPATVSGSTLTITGAGTVVVSADQAGTANYLAAPQQTRTVVVAAAPSGGSSGGGGSSAGSSRKCGLGALAACGLLSALALLANRRRRM